MNRLTDKLTRIPYPPATDEHHFDHAANLHRIGRIEEQLNSDMHSMSLLRAQLAKEEELLNQDEAEVKYLEQSLKSNDATRRQQSRTLHPMARNLLANLSDSDSLNLHDHEKAHPEPSLLTLFEDADMLPTLQQLQNHLDSMHNNIHDIKQVTQAISMVSCDLKSLPCAQSNQRIHQQEKESTISNQT